MLRQLWRLSHAFEVEGRQMCAPAVYAERRDGGWREAHASETGYEGVACVDDASRLATLLLTAYGRYGLEWALEWARLNLEFVAYMQAPDGGFANFILDWHGEPNLAGPTSRPGGVAWQTRAMRALSLAYRVTGVREYRERYYAALAQLPREIPYMDVIAVATLAALEMHAATGDPELQELVERWCQDMVGCRHDDVLLNERERPLPHLWAFIQPGVLCIAARRLRHPQWVKAAETTVAEYLEPIVRDGFKMERTMPYDVSSTVYNLDALHAATGASEYATLAGEARAWFHGRNTAGAPVYDAARGMVYDGTDGDRVSANSGAESNIEGGLALFEELPWGEYRFDP